jgi:hypothetical protein
MLPAICRIIFVDPAFFAAEMEITELHLIRIVAIAHSSRLPYPVRFASNEELVQVLIRHTHSQSSFRQFFLQYAQVTVLLTQHSSVTRSCLALTALLIQVAHLYKICAGCPVVLTISPNPPPKSHPMSPPENPRSPP